MLHCSIHVLLQNIVPLMVGILHSAIWGLRMSMSADVFRAGSAKDVVKRGQEVWVKVISMTGQRISLSMRDVDQSTGQDLLPGARMGADGVNPSGPAGAAPSQGLRGLSGIKVFF